MGVSEGEGSTKSLKSSCFRSRGFSVRLSTVRGECVVCVEKTDYISVWMHTPKDSGQLASIIINTLILAASSLKRSVSSTISLFRISSTMSSRVTTPAQQRHTQTHCDKTTVPVPYCRVTNVHFATATGNISFASSSYCQPCTACDEAGEKRSP